MKLLVLFDLHLEVGSFRVPDVEFDVVILAGDIGTPGGKVPSWARRTTNFDESTPIIFIPRNHEFDGRSMSSTLVNLRQASVGTNFHALDGAEVVLGGVRFLGCTLWSDFALHIDTPTGLRSDIARSSSEAGQILSDFHVIGVVDTIDAGTRSGARRGRRRISTPEDSMALHRQHRAWLLE
jgi:hypothetical protein